MTSPLTEDGTALIAAAQLSGLGDVHSILANCFVEPPFTADKINGAIASLEAMDARADEAVRRPELHQKSISAKSMSNNLQHFRKMLRLMI